MKNLKFQKAFRQFETDKAIHEYDRYYQKIIGNQKMDSILEIGVKYGKSLYAWNDIWPKSEIEGIDINVIDDEELNNKFKIYRMDSTNKNNGQLFTRKYDLIVDDGNHHWLSQYQTFKNFYDKANKFYVIEDIMGQYCVDKLYEKIGPEIISKSHLFPSQGSRATFTFSGNTEKDTCFYILFIPKDQ